MLLGKNLTKTYGNINSSEVHALNDVSIEVNNGDFLGVMGPSGSGKTTLLNLLSGLDKPSKGQVVIDNENLENMNDIQMATYRRNNIGFVFQDYNLLDSLTLEENILLPMILNNSSLKIMDEQLEKLMSLFNIYELKNKYPWNISGGQQQRASIARALINNPKIIFADEPTGNLDSKSSKEVMRYFTKINEELNTSILLVTHDALAASYCDRIIFIFDGRIKMEITKKGTQRDFFDTILNCLNVLGGSLDDF